MYNKQGENIPKSQMQLQIKKTEGSFLQQIEESLSIRDRPALVTGHKLNGFLVYRLSSDPKLKSWAGVPEVSVPRMCVCSIMDYT